ncbi:GTPase-activating protein [Tilletia horrida]|nr:GTPase-activating protein [Tilletia horrida]KAK0560670.1 GTPase-activating protein [Tilletia horrida]
MSTSKPAGGGVAAMAKRWEAAQSSSASASSSPSTTRPSTAKSAASSTATATAPSPPLPNAPKLSAGTGSALSPADEQLTSPTTPVLDPSIGAKSLIDPADTIINPFSLTSISKDDPCPPPDSPKRYSLTTDVKADLVKAASSIAISTSSPDTSLQTDEEPNWGDTKYDAHARKNSIAAAPPSVGTASSASRRESFQSATEMRRELSSEPEQNGASSSGHATDPAENATSASDIAQASSAKASVEHQDTVRASSHFSVVSLGGDDSAEGSAAEATQSSKRESHAHGAFTTSPTTITPLESRRTSKIRPESFAAKRVSLPPDSLESKAAAAEDDIALIRARLEAQTAQLERDPKAWRASIDGAAKIRQSFERKMHEAGGISGSPSSDLAFKRQTLHTIPDVASSETEERAGISSADHAEKSDKDQGVGEETQDVVQEVERQATVDDVTTPTLAQHPEVSDRVNAQLETESTPTAPSGSLRSSGSPSEPTSTLPSLSSSTSTHTNATTATSGTNVSSLATTSAAAEPKQEGVPTERRAEPVTGPSSVAAEGAQTKKAAGDEDSEEMVDWTFWGEIMSNYAEVARTRPQELSKAIRAGIPAALRGMMWQLMSSSKDEELEIIYAYYLKQTSPHEKAIRRDLSRTFPEQEYFADGKGVGQENLFNVIKAYSLYDEECGYCQGMQFVVGPLLLNMPDEEAFSTLARLMKSYDLRGHYIPNMPSLQLRLYQFDRLLEEFLPLLHRHLTRQGVKSSMYAAQWFMTLFSYRFPLELVYRILDSVFAEGIETLFRFSIALMQRNEEKLITLAFEEAVQFLKDNLFDAYLRETPTKGSNLRTPKASSSGPSVGTSNASEYYTAQFVQDAYQIRITPYQLDGYAAEFEEHVRKANAHRREVEALRLVNRNLSAKIKELEGQLTQVNNEHVDLVKQLVMAKLEKDDYAEELARYKLMYAEAVLSADQGSGPAGRGSSVGFGVIGSAGGSSTRTSRSGAGG